MPRGVFHSDDRPGKANNQLIIRRASPAQLSQHIDAVCPIWCDFLEAKVAAERYRHLRAASRFLGRHQVYVLVPASNPETLDLRCSGELFPVSLLMAPKGASEIQVEQVMLADCVNVLPKHRGNGYASLMSQQLYGSIAQQRALDGPSAPIALLGMSDCGEWIWQPVGETAESTETIWATEDLEPLPEDVEPKWLTVEDVKALAELDSRILAEKLLRRRDISTRFCLQPTAEMFEAALIMANTELAATRGARRVPEHHGVRFSERCYAIWIHCLDDDTLSFIRFQAETSDEAELLLRAATDTARWWSLPRVTAWAFDERVLRDAEGRERWPGVRSSPKRSCVPIAAWLEAREEGDKLDWCFTERYSLVLDA